MFQPRINVLFVSRRNSLRSLLAQACLNQIGRERFVAYSAGSAVPLDGRPHPLLVPALRAAGLSTEDLACRNWSLYTRSDRPMRFVITLADDAFSRAAPVWPGQPDTALWTFPDLLDPMRPQAVGQLADAWRRARRPAQRPARSRIRVMPVFRSDAGEET